MSLRAKLATSALSLVLGIFGITAGNMVNGGDDGDGGYEWGMSITDDVTSLN